MQRSQLAIISATLCATSDLPVSHAKLASKSTAPLQRERRHSGQLAASDTSACVALFLLSSTLLSTPSVTPKIVWPTHQLQCGAAL